jgi:type I restriction enzyme R subunit
MPNFFSEDDIEQAMVQRLQFEHDYDSLNCFTTDPEDLEDCSDGTNEEGWRRHGPQSISLHSDRD